jgi:hypothetical protein
MPDADPPPGTDPVRTTTLSFRERVDPLQLQAESLVTLDPCGRMSVRSCVSGIGRAGAHVGVVVLLYGGGSDPQWMWSSTPARFGVDEPDPGCVEVSATFVYDLDAELSASARHVAAKHFHSPGDAWTDVRDWLRAAQSSRHGYLKVLPVVQPTG